MPGAPSSIERKILVAAQAGIPISDRPFESLGRACGVSEADAIRRLSAAIRLGIVRQVSGIFDARSLGYATALVAVRLSPPRLASAARLVARQACVGHCYARRHSWNLWFTLAVPPGRTLSHAAAGIARRAGLSEWRLLPAMEIYKIGVRLDPGRRAPDLAEDEPASPRLAPPRRRLSAADRRIVRILQGDFPLVKRPFDALAAAAGTSARNLLIRARLLAAEGRLRRIAAVLAHRRAGFRANGMIVWPVRGAARANAIGRAVARFRAVTHAYRRPGLDEGLAVYAMVHGRTEAGVRRAAARISKAAHAPAFEILFSGREFKKERVRLFAKNGSRNRSHPADSR
ncbi:MAG: hypothetical protein AAB215_04020 [Planctomycetota bacterium]